MGMLFTIIPQGVAVLNNKGVFKQADLYEREGRVYAAWGSGYIGLRSDKGTTIPNVRCEWFDGVQTRVTKLGAIVLRTSQEL